MLIGFELNCVEVVTSSIFSPNLGLEALYTKYFIYFHMVLYVLVVNFLVILLVNKFMSIVIPTLHILCIMHLNICVMKIYDRWSKFGWKNHLVSDNLCTIVNLHCPKKITRNDKYYKVHNKFQWHYTGSLPLVSSKTNEIDDNKYNIWCIVLPL